MTARRILGLTNLIEPQILVVEADYAMRFHDQRLNVVTPDVVVTLPQNPVVGLTHLIYGSDVAWKISGGAANPLSTDPLDIGAGENVNAVFSTSGWQLGRDLAAQPTTVVPGRVKDLTDGAPVPILSVDIALSGDNSWGAKLFFNVEATDGDNVQLREGDANVALAYKTSTAKFATSQATNNTAASTGGTITVAFSWTTVGTVATLNVTATSNGIGVLTALRLHFFIAFMSHDIVTYIP